MLSETDLQTASMVLAKCAAYDPWFPKPDGEQAQATIQAWATAFKGAEPRWLLAGVDRWYAHNGAGERVLPADIRKKSAEIVEDFIRRLSPEQREVRDEQRLHDLMRARKFGEPNPPLRPLPQVALPHNPDESRLTEDQKVEWENVKNMKRALRDAEDELYAIEAEA